MKDRLGREIVYLRISVTTRCNLNCLYCRPDACPAGHPHRILTPQEFGRIVRVMVPLGIRKIRLTGGEPLLRQDLADIIREVLASGQIEDLSLTTNAQGLAERAVGLKQAGLMRVNISLDSLRSDRYREITGGGNLQAVLDGIKACETVGLYPIKLNTVLIRGINDDEISNFIELTRNQPIDLRFIELMPMNALGQDDNHVVTGSEMLAAWPQLQRIPARSAGQVSEDFRIPGFSGTVGFIRPISHRFCADCNRIRLTADGVLKPCLGSNGEVSLLDTLESDDADLQDLIVRTIWEKPEGHHFDNNFHPERGMDRTGG